MIINNTAVYMLSLNLRFGEKRTEEEIKKALRDEENPEHDYLMNLYKETLSLYKLKGGLKEVMEVKDLLKESDKNLKEISALSSKRDKEVERTHKEESIINDKYWKLESSLRESKSKEIQKLRKKEDG